MSKDKNQRKHEVRQKRLKKYKRQKAKKVKGKWQIPMHPDAVDLLRNVTAKYERMHGHAPPADMTLLAIIAAVNGPDDMTADEAEQRYAHAISMAMDKTLELMCTEQTCRLAYATAIACCDQLITKDNRSKLPPEQVAAFDHAYAKAVKSFGDVRASPKDLPSLLVARRSGYILRLGFEECVSIQSMFDIANQLERKLMQRTMWEPLVVDLREHEPDCPLLQGLAVDLTTIDLWSVLLQAEKAGDLLLGRRKGGDLQFIWRQADIMLHAFGPIFRRPGH